MEERSRRIVETAIALAERDGFEAVRLRDVAAQANVALGTVYRRFTSKEDILVAALQLYIGLFRDQVTADAFPGPTAGVRIDLYFQILTRLLVARPHLARALIRAVASGVPDVAARVTQFRDQMAALVELAMVGADGSACEVPLDQRQDVAFLLQNLWFAEIVGWAGGVIDEVAVQTNTRKATALVLAGAVARAGMDGGAPVR